MGFDDFIEKCAEIKKIALSFGKPTIVNHYDCDGLTSGAIVALALKAEGKDPEIITLRKLDDSIVNGSFVGRKEVIFVDFGGSCSAIDQVKDALVIDHHQTKGIKTPQANPQLHGFDGGLEISSAGVASLVFGRCEDLAVVGAVGDVQAPLIGLNRRILEQGVKNGLLSHGVDLKLYGKGARPLVQFLLYADEPYLPGITGNEEACRHVVEIAGIKTEKNATYNDLSDVEKKLLVGAIVDHLSLCGYKNLSVDLFGECYRLLKYDKRSELYEAAEFSTLLNACGRNDRPEIGLKVCMGDEGALEEARRLLALHKKNLQQAAEYAIKVIEDFGVFYLIDGRGAIDDSIIGVVAGMLISTRQKKPIIGLSHDKEGMVKISGRARRAHVEAGINLGLALKESCEKVGGVGGGHKQAAGATIPNDKVNEFLVEIAETINKQIKHALKA